MPGRWPDKVAVLYHADCTDGFGAAWAANQELGNRAKYLPVAHGEPVPDLEGAYPILLDFCYPLEVLHKFKERGGGLLVIDHHKTAQSTINQLRAMDGQVAVKFDLKKSGAVLAWEHFQPDQEVPMLLKYVQDRDLWQWNLPHSREVSAAISSYPQDFPTWDQLRLRTELDRLPGLVEEGRTILRQVASQVNSHVDLAVRREVAGYEVPCVNATVLQSEIGEALCVRFPEAPFSATFCFRGDKIVWSLRSRGSFDVSEVAKAKGGGGHPGAAGFTERIGG